MPSQQRITTRVATSEPRFIGYPTPAEGAPNVVVVVLDDIGFAQLGCFGGGIDTPNIDRLATEGLWTPLDISGPAPYLPQASGGMARLGGYYVTTRINGPEDAAFVAPEP